MIHRFLFLVRARRQSGSPELNHQAGPVRPSQLNPEGFHGDRYLQAAARTLLAASDGFVETGTNVGSTLAWVAREYPSLLCRSCEPDHEAFTYAQQNLAFASNVHLSESDSHGFFSPEGPVHRLAQQDILFWLDAHGYGFHWPLRFEVRTITSRWPRASILIDDFKVPGLDCFGFDAYDGQECSMAYIEDALNPHHNYAIYYPAYTDRTSAFHPLKGWVLIRYGYREEPLWPAELDGRLRRVDRAGAG